MDFDISTYREYGNMIIEPYITPNLGNQISSAKSKHHPNKCTINMRVWGDEEEGMRE